MPFVDLIRAKRDGEALERDQIQAFIAGVTDGSLPDYQISALLMAIVLRGMTAEETAWLTDAMVHSGTCLDLSDIPGVKVDKHSTGGVGDKTSLVLAPLAAACGAIVPMMSGRGLGHTGGTLDKLEAIPGFRVGLSIDELRAALRSVGCALIGQTSEIAPADKRLYALRDVTATVESLPLITASIMSKKIAEGIGGPRPRREGRTGRLHAIGGGGAPAGGVARGGGAGGGRPDRGAHHGDGCTAGPDGRQRAGGSRVHQTLKGNGPADLTDLSVLLAARMLRLAGIAATEDDAERRVRDALTSGAGLEKWRQIIANQGGDPRVVDDHRLLPLAPFRHVVAAPRSGYLAALDAGLIGRAAVALGAGRTRVDDEVDPAVGATLQAKPGARVTAGDPVVVLHYRRGQDLGPAVDLVNRAIRIDDEPPALAPLVRAQVGG